MSDEAWKAGGADPRPKPAGGGMFRIADEAYGTLPSVTKVATDVAQDLFANFGAYILCGLGPFLVLLPVTLIGVLAVYASLLVPLLVWHQERIAWELFVPAMALFIGVMVLVSAPIQYGTARAILAYQRDGEPLRFGSAFQHMTDDLGAAIGLEVLIAGMAFVAMLFCYVPVFGVSLLTSLAFPALVVHRLGAMGSLSASIEHVRKNIGWHVGFWALGVGILIICQNIPLIGPILGTPIYYAYQLRVYRQVFGDGEEPRAA